MEATMISKENIMNNLKELVAVPSFSSTEDENLGALKLFEIIKRIRYFQEHRDLLKLIPLENDRLKRNVVSAFVKAESETNDTIILTGHFDVVGSEEYGHLADVALNMDEVTARITELELDKETLEDVESGNWLFGRGSGDMKYGHALAIEVMRCFTEEEPLDVNLLYIAVPGEETNSEGMLRAIEELKTLQDGGMNYVALLNLEAFFDDTVPSSDVKYIHVGCSGKIMPLFLFRGVGAHAGELPFDGFDCNLMAAKLHELLHHNADFCDKSRGVTSSPPACLKMTDLKDSYNMTTPIHTAAYYNIITLNLNVDELIEKLKAVAEQAFLETVRIEKERAEDYELRAGTPVDILTPEPKILMLDDLYRAVEKTWDEFGKPGITLAQHLSDFAAKRLADGEEIQTVSIELFRELSNLYPDKNPMIVIGFIPPYYPDNYPNGDDPKTKRLFNAVEYIKGYARTAFDVELDTKDFYMGISDMCYVGLNHAFDYTGLFKNIAGIGDYYKFPNEDLLSLNIPAIIFGPWSKDAHKSTERIDIEYNFNVLPSLYIEFIKQFNRPS
jgi:arginine utilization protein RocB